MRKNYFFALILFGITNSYYAQDANDRKRIVQEYDLNKIQDKKTELESNQSKKRTEALKMAKLKNWPVSLRKDGGLVEELMRLTPDGFPIYYATENQAAARSTRVNHLNTGGSLGLTLDGQNMVARVWDGGTVRRTHNYLTGRVTTVDDVAGTSYNQHATHVTGTIISNAGGAFANVKGMAAQASAKTFNWTNDESEALQEVQDGMILSNHSYGVPVTNQTTNTTLPAWYIGSYVQESKDWDEIAYLSPYYLAVVSAGNDGNNNNNTDPISFGFDKLVGNKVAKNNLVIANAQDANVNNDGTLAAEVLINSSSSQGPSDDRRIKPDIAGNGTSVTSTSHGTNTATATLSGTSMAAPNVTGSLLLVQQHFRNVYQRFMKASTLKGLACHTADDSGAIGPDPVFGWGLLNAKAMVEAINSNGLGAWISENKLNQGQTYTYTVKADGTKPLVASITWTDVPGVANAGTFGVNSLNRALVNDLDIRISRNGTTYYPWRLQDDPTLEATRNSDNNVDNVEVVKIDNPVANAEYTITVTHKGNIVNDSQNYAFIITGAKSDIALLPLSDDKTICNSETASFNYSYKHNVAGTTNFTITGLPVGATGVLSTNSLSANGNITLNISNLNTVSPGEYNVGIIANNGIETDTRTNILKIFSTNFSNQVLSEPANEAHTQPASVKLRWVKNVNAESYQVQIATVADFATKLIDVNVTENSYLATGLQSETKYYWRVIQKNRCGQANIARNANEIMAVTTNNFTTGKIQCANIFTATDLANATIADTANALATVPVTVTGGYKIGDLKVNLDIEHSYIQDMTILLEGPAAIGSPVIYLFKKACGDNDNIVCTVTDAGGTPSCSGIPAISGNIAPFDELASLNHLDADGVWTLKVEDPHKNDGGKINSFSLEVCALTQSALSTTKDEFASLNVYPNPNSGQLHVALNEEDSNVELTIYDMQGRSVHARKMSSSFETINLNVLQNGMYFVTIENLHKKSTKKIILNK